MSKIAFVRLPGSSTVHVSVSTGKWLGADMHDVTICGQNIRIGLWTEAPRPTETGAESDYRRCKRCNRKRIEGVPAFDYEEELAGRASIHEPPVCPVCGVRHQGGTERHEGAHARYAQCDETCTVDCGHCKGAGRPTTTKEA